MPLETAKKSKQNNTLPFFKLPKAALYQLAAEKKVSAPVVVYIELNQYFVASGKPPGARLSQRQIERMTTRYGFSESAIKKAVRTLCAIGLIRRDAEDRSVKEACRTWVLPLHADNTTEQPAPSPAPARATTHTPTGPSTQSTKRTINQAPGADPQFARRKPGHRNPANRDNSTKLATPVADNAADERPERQSPSPAADTAPPDPPQTGADDQRPPMTEEDRKFALQFIRGKLDPADPAVERKAKSLGLTTGDDETSSPRDPVPTPCDHPQTPKLRADANTPARRRPPRNTTSSGWSRTQPRRLEQDEELEVGILARDAIDRYRLSMSAGELRDWIRFQLCVGTSRHMNVRSALRGIETLLSRNRFRKPYHYDPAWGVPGQTGNPRPPVLRANPT